MYKECPNCREGYNTVLERKDDTPIQEQYPNSLPWQREQLISGLCSGKCWREFLGMPEKKKSELATCLNKCKFFKKYKKNEGTDSGHEGVCSNINAMLMFATEEERLTEFEEEKDSYVKDGFPVFDIMTLQKRECPHYEKGKKK